VDGTKAQSCEHHRIKLPFLKESVAMSLIVSAFCPHNLFYYYHSFIAMFLEFETTLIFSVFKNRGSEKEEFENLDLSGYSDQPAWVARESESPAVCVLCVWLARWLLS
jgi:hypothetical protein